MHAEQSSAHRSELAASLAIVVSGAVWGLYWLPLRYLADKGIDGIASSMMLYAVSVIALLPYHVVRWRQFRDQGPRAVAVGVCLGGAFALYAMSLLLTEVVRSLLLFYLSPIWSTLIGAMLFGRPITRTRMLSIGLGVVGLLVVMDYRDGLPWPRNAGDWVALTSGFIWAIGSVISYRNADIGILESVTGFNLGGLLLSVVILGVAGAGLATVPARDAVLTQLPLLTALSLALFLPTSIALVWGVQRVDPGRVGILLMIELVVGAASAAVWTAEPFGLREAVGALMIIGAGLVEVLGRRRPAATA